MREIIGDSAITEKRAETPVEKSGAPTVLVDRAYSSAFVEPVRISCSDTVEGRARHVRFAIEGRMASGMDPKVALELWELTSDRHYARYGARVGGLGSVNGSIPIVSKIAESSLDDYLAYKKLLHPGKKMSMLELLWGAADELRHEYICTPHKYDDEKKAHPDMQVLVVLDMIARVAKDAMGYLREEHRQEKKAEKNGQAAGQDASSPELRGLVREEQA